jgi:hypothetical protein
MSHLLRVYGVLVGNPRKPFLVADRLQRTLNFNSLPR